MPHVREITAQLVADGYEPGMPVASGGLGCALLDISTAAAAVCGCCDYLGLDCRQFVNTALGSYRVFAVCPSCGAAEEF